MEESASPQSPTCSLFACFATKESIQERKEILAHRRASRRIGVERQMHVTYTQPHLVEPMKLTVYDDLPSTPVALQQPSQISKFVSHSRKSLSRASTRASLAARRRTPKSSISMPQLAAAPERCQLRRNPSFRPLQLSIYASDKRLSDLPEFDAVSFTDEGEIKLPPRALVRTQSEDMLRPRSPVLPDMIAAKPASMFEQSLSRRMSHVRHNTDSTLISSSRPASEYDALHSHPVSWCSMPGLPPTMQFASAPALTKTILSPMQEEFTPPPSGAVIINGKVLAFPDIDANRVPTEMAHTSLLPPARGQEGNPAAPSPTVDPGPNRRTRIVTKHKTKISEAASILIASSNTSTRTRATTLEQPEMIAAQPFEQPHAYFHTDFKTNNRINQWLNNDAKALRALSRDSSISTIKTSTTTSSFAEHRRKRSQFYQVNQTEGQPADTNTSTSAATHGTSSTKLHKTPAPLTLYQPFPPRKASGSQSAAPQPSHNPSKSSVSLKLYTHARSQTTSTVASTIATDVLFERVETPVLDSETRKASSRRAYDAESVTTIDMKSRTGTMKSTLTTASSSKHQFSEAEANPGVEIIAVTKGTQVSFRGNTPSPLTESPQTPLSAKARDVEKMMFEMCAAGGFRRVNVGVAF